jgi:hypothetical protein
MLMYRKAVSTDDASNSWTVKIPTSTQPSFSTTTPVGPVWWLRDPNLGIAMNHQAPKFLNIVPYGTDTNNQTFSVRVWGWNRMGLITTPLWVPTLLVELVGTLSNAIDCTALATGAYGCDTITATYGATDEKTLGVSLISPTTDIGQASALVHLRGAEYIEFAFKSGASAVSMNALWRCMDQD